MPVSVVYQFTLSLNRSFQLLNLKNDALRKRYDGIKYDMKRIEEIVYDVTVHDVNGIEEDMQLRWSHSQFIQYFMPQN